MTDLNKIINEQRERIVELEKGLNRLRKHKNDMGAEYSSLERHYKRIAEDEKKRAEAAERERDGIMNSFLQLKGESYSCAQCGNEVECKHFDIFNDGIVDELLNKFAIEQQIKVLDEFALVPLSVANHHCDKEIAGYMWLHDAMIDKLNHLHQQLNGGK